MVTQATAITPYPSLMTRILKAILNISPTKYKTKNIPCLFTILEFKILDGMIIAENRNML